MKVIAHRGASGYAPENTLASIKKAIELSADGIEIDIQLTKDKKIVVFHDWKLDRTTNGKGFIYESNFDYIRSLDAGSWFSDQFIGEKVPTLEEVLEILPKNMLLNIEIKDLTRADRGIIEELMVDVLKKYPEKFDQILISSFHHSIIKKLQQLCPKLKLALLTCSELINVAEYISQSNINIFSYHPEINLITKEAVQSLRKNNIFTYVWTVNKEEDFNYLKSIGVDAVITNYPDSVKDWIKK